MQRPAVVFWQNMPCHHQCGALEALAGTWGAPVVGVWQEGVRPERRALGWQVPESRALEQRTLDRERWPAEVRELVARHRDAIHVFSGIGPYRAVTHAARLVACRRGARMGLVVEGGEEWTWRRWPRYLRNLVRYAPYLGRVRAVLAMGGRGVRYYRSIGFARDRVYPYCYQSTFAAVEAPVRADGVLRIGYVGQLVRRKGVDLLIAALGRMRQVSWILEIVGDGEERERLVALARELGIDGRVRFRGVVPAGSIASALARLDVVVVPSRFDGWGVSTNEALQCGLAVIASDAAASSDLVRASGAGSVFGAGRVDELAHALLIRAREPERLAEERRRARSFAPRIAPDVVGGYLGRVLEHAFLGAARRPQAPWVEVDADRPARVPPSGRDHVETPGQGGASPRCELAVRRAGLGAE